MSEKQLTNCYKTLQFIEFFSKLFIQFIQFIEQILSAQPSAIHN